MTKVITYNNIQLSFQADTSGIKASKAELGALTRAVNAQRTPLEKFMRNLEVINQRSTKMAPKEVQDRIRAVANMFLEAEKKAGRYRDALSALEAFTPQLAQEAQNLRRHYDDLIKTEKELADIENQLTANRKLQGMVIQPAELAAIELKKQQADEIERLAKEETAIAEKQAAIKRTLLKQERDEYVNAHLDMLKSRQKLLQAHVFQPAESAKIIAAQAESQKAAELELQNQRMSAGLGIQIFEQSKKILSVREKSVATIEAENKALQAQKENQDVILSLQNKLLDLQRSEKDKAALSRQAQIDQFRQREFQKAAIQVQELKRKAAESMTVVDPDALKRIFENVRNNIQQHIILLNEVEVKEKQITQRAKEKAEAERAAAEAIKAQSAALEKEIQKEKEAAAAIQRRLNLYQRLPSMQAIREKAMTTGREFASGASMAGVPGGMLFGMSKTAIGGFAAAGAVIGSLKAFSDLRSQLVRLEIQFGSTAVAAQKFSEIRQLAAQTPLETRDLMSAATSLAQYGFTAQEVVPALKQLAEISAGDAMRMEGLSRAFAQVKAAGRLMGQEVLQFVNSGFNPLAEISRVTGIEMARLKKLMEEGKITFQDVADSLKSATSEGGAFYQQSAKQAEELSAKYNALKDSVRQLGEAFGELLGPTASAIMEKMTFIFENMAASTKAWGEILANIFGSEKAKTFTEIFRDLETRLIEIEAKGLKIDYGGITEKDGKLFENLRNTNRQAAQEDLKAIAEKRIKEFEKIKERIDGLKKTKELEQEIAKLSMTDFERKKLEANNRLLEIRKEAMERAKAEVEIDMLRRNSSQASIQAMQNAMRQANTEIANAKLQAERLPFMDRFEEIRKTTQEEFFKKSPQAKVMQEAVVIANMIKLGMLSVGVGSQELARVMMENTQATQQQSQELPRTIQAGTVEAYQAMFGKDNTAKLQLSEQKKQNDKLSEANGILKQIAAKPGMKKV